MYIYPCVCTCIGYRGNMRRPDQVPTDSRRAQKTGHPPQGACRPGRQDGQGSLT